MSIGKTFAIFGSPAVDDLRDGDVRVRRRIRVMQHQRSRLRRRRLSSAPNVRMTDDGDRLLLVIEGRRAEESGEPRLARCDYWRELALPRRVGEIETCDEDLVDGDFRSRPTFE